MKKLCESIFVFFIFIITSLEGAADLIQAYKKEGKK